jgi:hypothetical protein
MAATAPVRKRLVIAGLALGGIVLLDRAVALALADDPAPPVRPRAERAGPARDAPARDAPAANDPVQRLQLDRLNRRDRPADDEAHAADASDPGTRVFDAVAFEPPPPPAPPAPPQARPAAPAFPYAYLGSVVDDDVRTVFFAKGDRVLLLKAGETVDGAYRVDGLAQTEMTVTYLPLNLRLQVPLGAAP